MRSRKLIAGLAAAALFSATMPAKAAGEDAGGSTDGTTAVIIGLMATGLVVAGIVDAGKSP